MALAFVNAGANDDQSGSFTTPITSAFNLAAGNLVVCAFRSFDDFAFPPPTVTDTAGNNYFLLYDRLKAATGSGTYQYLGFCCNCNGHATNVISADENVRYWGMVFAQYSGVIAINGFAGFDVKAVGDNSSGTTVTSGSFTTTQADEVIVAVGDDNSGAGVWTQDTGFTTRATVLYLGNDIIFISDKIVSSIQTGATITVTYSTSAGLSLMVSTYKAISAPASSRPVVWISM
jgi:hypothetical protein